MKRVRFAKANPNHARWKRSNCCASNPQTTTHRSAVINRYNASRAAESDVTKLALDKLSSFSLADDVDDEFDARTVDTSFSAFSGVSISASFKGIESHWRRAGEDPIAKEICSLAATLHDMTGESNADENDQSDKIVRVKQFGALVMMMEKSDNDQTLTAASYLLSLVISKINPQILRNQYDRLVQVLGQMLTDSFKSESVMLLKSLLVCYAEVLMHQPMKTLCDAQEQACLFASFIHHTHPKVRKVCFRLVSVMIGSSDVIAEEVCPPRSHPLAQTLAESFSRHLTDESQSVQHRMRSMNLVKALMAFLSGDFIKRCLESFLSVCSGTEIVLRKKAFQCIHLFFAQQPETSVVTTKLNGQLLSALEELRPSILDEDLILVWLTVYDSVLGNLSRSAPEMYSSHFLSFVTYCLSGIFSSSMENTVRLAGQIIQQHFFNVPEGVSSFWYSTKDDKLSDICKISEILAELTSFKYEQNSKTIHAVISKVYSSLGERFFQTLSGSLLCLCALRTNNETSGSLRDALASAVQAFGPENFLSVCPLNFSGQPDDDFSRSWILPLFATSVKISKLATWQNIFYPIGKSAESHIESLQHKPVELRTLQVLHSQVWQLFPVFCKNCTDAAEAFTPGFAKHLSSLLGQNFRASHSILDGLKALVESDSESCVNAIVKFSRNYLPQLFNTFLGEDTEVNRRIQVLGVCSAFMRKVSQEELASYFDNALKRLTDPECELQKQKYLMDLIKEQVPYLSSEKLDTVFDTLIPFLLSKNDLRKKTWLTLKRLFAKSEEKDESVKRNLIKYYDKLFPLLLESYSKSSTSTKKHSMKCLAIIVETLPEEHMKWLDQIFPLVVVSLRKEKKSVKDVAVKTLKALCNTYIASQNVEEAAAVNNLISFLTQSLKMDLSDETVSVFIALQYVIALYRDSIISEVQKKLFIMISTYLKKATKPSVFEPAFHLLKILMSVLPYEDLISAAPEIVKQVCEWNTSTGNKYRFTVRVIMFRLCRKLGSEIVEKNCPENHKKLVTHIRKQISREERARKGPRSGAGSAIEDEEDDDSGNEGASQNSHVTKAETIADVLMELESSEDEAGGMTSRATSRRSRRSTNSVFINEANDGIVNLADRSSGRYLTSKAPSKESLQKKKEQPEVKFAPDGRLILFGDDGKPLVGAEEKKKEELKDRQLGIQSDTDDTENEDEEDMPLKKRKKLSKLKSDISTTSSRFSGKSRKREQKPAVKTQRGEKFKAKKAGGDMKLKGQPDPYAFVPLDTRVLNKRKAKKLEGRFKGLIKASRKGVSAKRTGTARKK